VEHPVHIRPEPLQISPPPLSRDLLEVLARGIAFLPVLIERLVTMAGTLTDEQRQSAIAELEPMHKKLEALYQTQEEILGNAEKELEEIRKKDLPAVMHLIEEDEHKDADTIFATQLQAI
jgi:hypothetical protein